MTARARVTFTAVVPSLATGLDLLDALATTNGCVAASIEETRGNHVSLESPRVTVRDRSKSITSRSNASLPVSTRDVREPRDDERECDFEDGEGEGEGDGAGELTTPLLVGETEARVDV